ncbi:rRNA methylase [Caldalkalibacillus thermarum TA2.A1]|uniref:Class I SAM-dependent methyltransferase n=1 Tax=Caldalkalibacillus thermarum (strain TA2.A1) TaxID=986075 RepID=F5L4Z0_CALTT|nr:class I SAM-dependent methyltransferase [Caldalkalibacillus thermarum]EGL83603.1 rRNA methylase [Caldalkalibacillus thermarum TA2.A1]QZT32518.1 class I SAM-dependent methyltransferase [Caldalkalibacillus thermarum TA2.A1]
MSNLLGILPFTRLLIEQTVQPGDLVVDATMGNGHDTLFLARLVGPKGKVLAYDVQQEAIDKTKKRLKEAHCLSQVQLLHKGHETVEEELQYYGQPLSAAMFNLGYLPGSDKTVVTQPETTLAALGVLARYLKPGGLITIVVYSGHAGGKTERDALLAELGQWDQKQYHVLQYRFINQQNDPPFLVAIEKR